nr:hypothetical protein [uncultured Dongia sp.]
MGHLAFASAIEALIRVLIFKDNQNSSGSAAPKTATEQNQSAARYCRRSNATNLPRNDCLNNSA